MLKSPRKSLALLKFKVKDKHIIILESKGKFNPAWEKRFQENQLESKSDIIKAADKAVEFNKNMENQVRIAKDYQPFDGLTKIDTKLTIKSTKSSGTNFPNYREAIDEEYNQAKFKDSLPEDLQKRFEQLESLDQEEKADGGDDEQNDDQAQGEEGYGQHGEQLDEGQQDEEGLLIAEEEAPIQEEIAQEEVAQEEVAQEEGGQDAIAEEEIVQEEKVQKDVAQEDQDKPAQEEVAQQEPGQDEKETLDHEETIQEVEPIKKNLSKKLEKKNQNIDNSSHLKGIQKDSVKTKNAMALNSTDHMDLNPDQDEKLQENETLEEWQRKMEHFQLLLEELTHLSKEQQQITLVYILKKEVNLQTDFEMGMARITRVIDFIRCGKLQITLEELHELCVKAKIEAGMIIEDAPADFEIVEEQPVQEETVPEEKADPEENKHEEVQINDEEAQHEEVEPQNEEVVEIPEEGIQEIIPEEQVQEEAVYEEEITEPKPRVQKKTDALKVNRGDLFTGRSIIIRKPDKKPTHKSISVRKKSEEAAKCVKKDDSDQKNSRSSTNSKVKQKPGIRKIRQGAEERGGRGRGSRGGDNGGQSGSGNKKENVGAKRNEKDQKKQKNKREEDEEVAIEEQQPNEEDQQIQEEQIDQNSLGEGEGDEIYEEYNEDSWEHRIIGAFHDRKRKVIIKSGESGQEEVMEETNQGNQEEERNENGGAEELTEEVAAEQATDEQPLELNEERADQDHGIIGQQIEEGIIQKDFEENQDIFNEETVEIVNENRADEKELNADEVQEVGEENLEIQPQEETGETIENEERIDELQYNEEGEQDELNFENFKKHRLKEKIKKNDEQQAEEQTASINVKLPKTKEEQNAQIKTDKKQKIISKIKVEGGKSQSQGSNNKVINKNDKLPIKIENKPQKNNEVKEEEEIIDLTFLQEVQGDNPKQIESEQDQQIRIEAEKQEEQDFFDNFFKKIKRHQAPIEPQTLDNEEEKVNPEKNIFDNSVIKDHFVLKSLAAGKSNNVKTIDQYVIDKPSDSLINDAIQDDMMKNIVPSNQFQLLPLGEKFGENQQLNIQKDLLLNNYI